MKKVYTVTFVTSFGSKFQLEAFEGALHVFIESIVKFFNGTHKKNKVEWTLDSYKKKYV